MTGTAPITQDVLTIPRKVAEDKQGRVNLVGLTRDGLREALLAAGTPERQVKMRAGQVWQWVYHWGVRDFDAMTNLSQRLPRAAGRAFRDRAARGRDPSGVRRRNAQVSGADRGRA